MSKSLLTIKHFQDKEAAYAYVEERLWPNGPFALTAALLIEYPK